MAMTMLDYLQAIALLALIGTHFALVRGCFTIKSELPIQGGILASRLDRTADLIDEVAQLISDLGDATQQNLPTQTQAGLGEVLTTWLMTKATIPPDHGSQKFEGQIYENSNDSQTNSFEGIEHHQYG